MIGEHVQDTDREHTFTADSVEQCEEQHGFYVDSTAVTANQGLKIWRIEDLKLAPVDECVVAVVVELVAFDRNLICRNFMASYRGQLHRLVFEIMGLIV